MVADEGEGQVVVILSLLMLVQNLFGKTIPFDGNPVIDLLHCIIENAIVKVVALKIGHVPIPERGEKQKQKQKQKQKESLI